MEFSVEANVHLERQIRKKFMFVGLGIALILYFILPRLLLYTGNYSNTDVQLWQLFGFAVCIFVLRMWQSRLSMRFEGTTLVFFGPGNIQFYTIAANEIEKIVLLDESIATYKILFKKYRDRIGQELALSKPKRLYIIKHGEVGRHSGFKLKDASALNTLLDQLRLCGIQVVDAIEDAKKEYENSHNSFR